LAYVVRVGDRAYVACAAASCCPRLRSKKINDAAGLRIARLAYVMHYSLGTRGLHARLCETLGKVFGARLNLATITYNAKASLLAAHQHIQSSSASSAPTCSVISRDTMHCDPPYERMAAKTRASLARCIFHCILNSVTAPFMAEPNNKT